MADKYSDMNAMYGKKDGDGSVQRYAFVDTDPDTGKEVLNYWDSARRAVTKTVLNDKTKEMVDKYQPTYLGSKEEWKNAIAGKNPFAAEPKTVAEVAAPTSTSTPETAASSGSGPQVSANQDSGEKGVVNKPQPPQQQMQQQRSGGPGIVELEETNTQRTLVDKQAEEKKKQANEALGKLIMSETEAKVSKNNAEVAQAQAETARMQRQAEDDQALLSERNQRASNMWDDLSKLNSQVMSMQVDPNRMLGDGVTGRKIAAGISIALGGMGMALAGRPGENPALKIIEDAIDRDIAAQESNIRSAQANVTQARGLLGDYAKITGDMDAAKTAYRRDLLEMAKQRIEQTMKSSESAVIQAGGAKAVGDINMKLAEEEAKLGQRLQTVSIKQVPITPKNTDKDAKFTVEQIDKLNEYKKSIGSFEEAEKAMQDPEVVKGFIVGSIAQQLADWGWADAEQAAASTKNSLAMRAFLKAMSGAQVTDFEFKKFATIMPKPGDTEEAIWSKFAAIKEMLQNEYQITYDTYEAARIGDYEALKPKDRTDKAQKYGVTQPPK